MTSTGTIRAFKAEDEPAIIALWSLTFPDDPPWNAPADVIAQKQRVQPELFLVYVLTGRVVGTVLAGFDGTRGWLHKLAVHPDYQRRGIAEQLLARAETGLREVGCHKLNIQVRAANRQVLGL